MINRVIINKTKVGNFYKYVFKYQKDLQDITDPDTLDRIKKLVIPPQWTSVQITEEPNDYLQVIGLDKNGKTQYIYHPAFILLTDQEKYIRLKHFCQKIHLLFDHIKKIKRNFNDKNYIIGLMFRLLQKTHIRIGNECYADKTRENGPTYGLTTLEKRHVLINGSEITLDFIGKKNVRNTITINSASLSRDLLILKDSCKNTDRIFKTTDNIIVGSNDMNNFLNEAIGSTEFSCKDFRTYASNISFIKKLCLFKNTKDMSQKTIEQNIKSIFKDVSKELNHSEAISKGSYIIPHILERYKEDPLYFKKSDSVDNLLIKLL